LNQLNDFLNPGRSFVTNFINSLGLLPVSTGSAAQMP
jgi:hypothetical protein